MDERTMQFRVGIMVIATLLIALFLVIWMGELPGVVTDEYTLHIKFQQAPGVRVNTPIRKSGILIGRVAAIELQEDGVLVTARMHDSENKRIFRDEICQIGSESLLGDAVLEFIPSGDPGDSRELVKRDEYITGSIASDPLNIFVGMEDDLVQTLSSVRLAGEEIAELAGHVNGLMDGNGDRFSHLMEKTDVALDRFTQAMDTINHLVGDQELQNQLRQALSDVPMMLEESRETLAGIRRMTDAAEVNLGNLERFTEPLGERGDDIVAELENTISHLDEFFVQLRDLSSSLNSSEGTIGQLIHNPDLYQRLNRAAENVEYATRQLDPLLSDARIFMDKLARNPRQLGVQGALDRERSGPKFLLPFQPQEEASNTFQWPY